jgi:hypothetical protein
LFMPNSTMNCVTSPGLPSPILGESEPKFGSRTSQSSFRLGFRNLSYSTFFLPAEGRQP